MPEGETRFAILIGNSQYPEDERLMELRCPERDVEALADVLSHPEIGRFDHVKPLKNVPHHTILETILEVLNQARRDDLVLLYFSGHGKLDEQDRLYLTATNTRSPVLAATAAPLELIKDFIDNRRSTRIVIILDCCFSGAAGKTFGKGGVDDRLQQLSGGRGKYILTASTATQTAQEKEGDTLSVFTKHVVEGLRTGQADLDEDGHITVDELYRYVYSKVREENHQEPMQWDLSRKGDLVIAWRPHGQATAPGSSIQARYDTIVRTFEEGNVIPFL